MNEKFYTTERAAVFLNLAKSTLDKRRVTGGGPVYRKIGRYVRYAESDLIAWLNAARRSSTSCGVKHE